MARALKCDICGNFYMPKFSMSSRDLNDDGGYSRKLVLATLSGDGTLHFDTTTAFDICPDCTEKVINWIKGEENA